MKQPLKSYNMMTFKTLNTKQKKHNKSDQLKNPKPHNLRTHN